MSGGETSVFEYVVVVVSAVATIAVCVAMFFILKRAYSVKYDQLAQEKIAECKRVQEEAERQAEARRKEALVEAKDEAYRLRAEMERENREKRAETQRLERRLAQREEGLERRLEAVEKKEHSLQQHELELDQASKRVDDLAVRQQAELRRISGLSPEEARAIFLRGIEEQYRHEAAKWSATSRRKHETTESAALARS